MCFGRRRTVNTSPSKVATPDEVATSNSPSVQIAAGENFLKGREGFNPRDDTDIVGRLFRGNFSKEKVKRRVAQLGDDNTLNRLLGG